MVKIVFNGYQSLRDFIKKYGAIIKFFDRDKMLDDTVTEQFHGYVNEVDYDQKFQVS